MKVTVVERNEAIDMAAEIVSYMLRLPLSMVKRSPYCEADIENISNIIIQKWELL